MKENVKKPIFRLTLSAIFIALATVLSMIKIYEPPLGGGVTLFSMLPIIMLSCMFGMKWGLGVSFAYGIVQMMLSFAEVCSWGLTPWVLVATFVFDYVLAYFVLGFSGAFRKMGYVGVIVGTAFVLLLRFLCHFVSGIVLFGQFADSETWIYSLTYNGSYMLPELIITAVAASVLFGLPQIKRLINRLAVGSTSL